MTAYGSYTAVSVDPDPFDWSKATLPTSPLPFPTSLVLWAGRVAVSWTIFDQVLSETIRHLIAASKQPEPPGWERMNFKKKKELCRTLVDTVILKENGLHPWMHEILDKSAELAWRRNSLIHGQHVGPVHLFGDVPFEVQPAIFTTAYHNKKRLELEFNEQVLESIYYGICNLTGALLYLNSMQTGVPVYLPADMDMKIEQTRLAKEKSSDSSQASYAAMPALTMSGEMSVSFTRWWT